VSVEHIQSQLTVDFKHQRRERFVLHEAFFENRISQLRDVRIQIRAWEADVEALQDLQFLDRNLPEVRATTGTFDLRNAS